MEKLRCVHCRSLISVPDSYAHGDHIKCGTCGTQHKVQRGDVLRLVIADVTPLQEALKTAQQRIASLEAELHVARASFGIGANGIGVGVAYVIWQVALKDRTWSSSLAWEGITVAIVSGALLELANFLFLAKRQAMARLAGEIQTLRDEARVLQQRIREGLRG